MIMPCHVRLFTSHSSHNRQSAGRGHLPKSTAPPPHTHTKKRKREAGGAGLKPTSYFCNIWLLVRIRRWLDGIWGKLDDPPGFKLLPRQTLLTTFFWYSFTIPRMPRTLKILLLLDLPQHKHALFLSRSWQLLYLLDWVVNNLMNKSDKPVFLC